ncbi:PfkB family carbohydrate kinase [Escherichia coli]
MPHSGGSATAIFPAGGATGEHRFPVANGIVPVATVEAKDWTRQNYTYMWKQAVSSIVLLCSAALNEDEFRQLEEQVLEIESGAILVISGSLPPGVKLEKLTQLISAAQNQGIRCIIDSSGEALVQHWRLVTSSWLSVTKKNSVRW